MGRHAAEPLIRRTGQLHHQIGAKGSEATVLLRAEDLPAINAHQGGIRAHHQAIRAITWICITVNIRAGIR